MEARDWSEETGRAYMYIYGKTGDLDGVWMIKMR